MRTIDIKDSFFVKYNPLKILAYALIALSVIVFIYFFSTYDFQMHYLISTGCFLFLFCGILFWIVAFIGETEKKVELSYENSTNLIKRTGWLTIFSFWYWGLSMYSGMLFIAIKDPQWKYAIIIFTTSIISFLLTLFGILQRRITKQNVELKKQQTEIIELLQSNNESSGSNTLLA